MYGCSGSGDLALEVAAATEVSLASIPVNSSAQRTPIGSRAKFLDPPELTLALAKGNQLGLQV
ncbi:MAG: hypothetical protein NTW28_17510 [Candidatus Solibacter sp.]|nr:hypothetical protein [Candidatus Solibacter sp.]